MGRAETNFSLCVLQGVLRMFTFPTLLCVHKADLCVCTRSFSLSSMCTQWRRSKRSLKGVGVEGQASASLAGLAVSLNHLLKVTITTQPLNYGLLVDDSSWVTHVFACLLSKAVALVFILLKGYLYREHFWKAEGYLPVEKSTDLSAVQDSEHNLSSRAEIQKCPWQLSCKNGHFRSSVPDL